MYRYLFIAVLAGIGGYELGLSDGLLISDALIARMQELGGLPLVGN